MTRHASTQAACVGTFCLQCIDPKETACLLGEVVLAAWGAGGRPVVAAL